MHTIVTPKQNYVLITSPLETSQNIFRPGTNLRMRFREEVPTSGELNWYTNWILTNAHAAWVYVRHAVKIHLGYIAPLRNGWNVSNNTPKISETLRASIQTLPTWIVTRLEDVTQPLGSAVHNAYSTMIDYMQE